MEGKEIEVWQFRLTCHTSRAESCDKPVIILYLPDKPTDSLVKMWGLNGWLSSHDAASLLQRLQTEAE